MHLLLVGLLQPAPIIKDPFSARKPPIFKQLIHSDSLEIPKESDPIWTCLSDEDRWTKQLYIKYQIECFECKTAAAM